VEPEPLVGHHGRVSHLQTISFRQAAFALVALTLLIHGQAIGHEFTWNDGTNILANEALTEVGNIPSFFVEAWGAAAEDATYRDRNSQYWRPVPMALWTLEAAAFGLTPAPFHALNVLLHALTALLLLAFAWRLLPAPGPGRVGVLLGVTAWAVHPVHTEVVHVVSYGSDLLAGLFTMACLAVWMGAEGRSASRARLDRVFVVPVLFALGVGSKEMAVTVPVLLAVVDLCVLPRTVSVGARVARLIPVGLVLVGYFGVRVTLLGGGGQDFYAGAAPEVVLFSMLDVLALYGRLILAPWPLSPFYDWSALPPQETVFAVGPIVGLLLLVGWCALGGWLWRRERRLVFTVMLPLIVWIPVSHIVPIIIAAADRFLYVAAAGPLLLAAVACARSERAKLWLTLMSLVVVCHAGVTVVRGADWHDDRTILEASVRDWPTSFNAWYGLAALHAREGRTDEAEAIWRRIGVDPVRTQGAPSD
jgi:protein O-mannosyl-transferase